MQERNSKDQEIRDMLIQLHNELAQAQNLDEDERAMMRHLMNDIQDALERDEEARSSEERRPGSLADRLDKAITRLEVSHPTLTTTLKKVVDTLTVAGI